MRAVEPRSPDSSATASASPTRCSGTGSATVVFIPIDPIIESRAWKAQVPWLTRRARVITIDPRGNGRSDRPTDPAAYGRRTTSSDTLAVMDELGVESAVLVGSARRPGRRCSLAAGHPERVDGWSRSPRWLPYLTPPLPERVQYPDDEVPDTEEGWAKVTNWLPAQGLPRGHGVLLRRVRCRAALVEGDRGLRRLGPAEHRRRPDPGQTPAPSASRAANRRRRCWPASAVPCWSCTATTTAASPPARAELSPR